MSHFGSQRMTQSQSDLPGISWDPLSVGTGNRGTASRILLRVFTSVRHSRAYTLPGVCLVAALIVCLAAVTPVAEGQGFRRVIVSRGRAFPDVGSGVTALKRDAAGRYYVLAKPANVIRVYNSDGVRIGQIPAADATGATISYAVDFDLDSKGNVLVADRAANAIEIFSPQGSLLSRVKIFAPTSVVSVTNGQFAVTTLRSSSLVVVLDSDGKVVRKIGDIPDAEPSAPPVLADLGRVSGDADGNIYFAFASQEPLVRKYDRFGYIACQAIVPRNSLNVQTDTPDDRVQFGFSFSQYSLSDQFSGWTTVGLSTGTVNFGASTGMGLERAGFGHPGGGWGGAEFGGGGPDGGSILGGDGAGGPKGGGRGASAGVVGSFQNGQFRLAPRVGAGARGGRRGAAAGAPGADGAPGGSTGQTSTDPNAAAADQPGIDTGSGQDMFATSQDSSTTGALQYGAGQDGGDLSSSDLMILQNESPNYTVGGAQYAGLGALPVGSQGFAALGNYLGPPPGGTRLPPGGGLSAIMEPSLPKDVSASGNTSSFGQRNFGGEGGPGGFGHYGHFGGINAYSAVATVKVNLDKAAPSNDIAKNKITAIGVDRATQEIWVAMGSTLVHFDKEGNQLDSYPLTTPQGQALAASAIEVESDRLLVASDAHGIYEFARPDPKTAAAASAR
jgi:hypothetical protein